MSDALSYREDSLRHAPRACCTAARADFPAGLASVGMGVQIADETLKMEGLTMASPERVENLKTYCIQWMESSENLTKRRDELLSWQSSGIHVFESGSRQDLLPTMIAEADAAAKNVYAILIRMEALRDRAIAGDDV